MKPKATERPWYRFTNEAKAGDELVDLYIFDVIGETWEGDSVTAKRFVQALEALPASVRNITLHINSPGGSVFDAVGIANVLRAHRAKVDVKIEGLAASAATVVAMAGDRVGIAENALFMIHDPYGFAMGGAKDMRATADALDRVRDAIVATYKWHSPLEPAAIGDLMTETTWMTAAEAVEKGFADEVTATSEARAQLPADALEALGPIPERFAAAATVKVEPPPIVTTAAVDKSSPPQTPQLEEAQTMTDDEIKALVDKTRTEAHEAGRTAERERLLGIEGALIPGHEKLIAEMKLDAAVTPGEAALRVNAAERAGRERSKEALRKDGETTAVVGASNSSATGDTNAVDDPRKPLEERAKVIWDNSPEVRAEFEGMGGFESYVAWRKAEASGSARILKAVK